MGEAKEPRFQLFRKVKDFVYFSEITVNLP